MSTMFSGNRVISPKTPTEKKELIKSSRITLLFSAEKLLKSPKYQKLIEQCEQLLEFTPEQRDVYLMPLIHSFVECVQNLPETRNSYYSKPGGFIAHALVRTATALSMCRAYFSANAKDKNNTSLSTQEMLWMYALFSAGIFNGIGKIFSDLVVEVYDDTGKHLDRWNPFNGSMLGLKAYSYDYDFEEAQHIDLFSRRVSVLLAKQLMPSQGFAWISSDKEVLSFWLALLEDNQRDSGTLGPFMVRADALAINTYFDEKRMQRQYGDLDVEAKAEADKIEEEKEEQEDKQENVEDNQEENKEKVDDKLAEKDKEKIQLRFSATFAPPPDTEKQPPGSEGDKAEKRNPNTQAGVEFLKWLNNQLKTQRFEFNDSIFFMPTGAIFLPTALFEEFRRKNPYYRSQFDVIDSFNKLQLHTKGSEKSDLHTFTHTHGEATKKIQGIILNNAQLVLPKSINIRLASGEKQTVSASHLSDYKHLFDPLQPIGKGPNIAPPPEQRNHTGLFGGR
jgi:hypothetical protein